ncbi:MAG: hypothetical protein N2C14_30170, partial [Planctomycetales bacterium]
HGEPMQDNPYISPRADFVARSQQARDPSEADLLRRSCLATEEAIHSAAAIYYLSAGFCALLGGFLCVLGTQVPTVVPAAAAGVIFSLISYTLARGLQNLDPRVKLPVVVFSAAGMALFPVGTLIGAEILYVMYSAKGHAVFSSDYKDVIRRTPHIHHQVILLDWILLIMMTAALFILVTSFLPNVLR